MEKIDFSFRKKTKRWLGWLTFCLMLFMGQTGFAQVSTYSFSQSVETFTSIATDGVVVTGSEATTGTTNDTSGWSVTIPFSFNFNGGDYTSIYVNSNGGATFGSTTSNASTVISTTTAYDGAIAVMNRDLWGVFITSGVTTSGSDVITNVGNFYGLEIGKQLNSVNGIPSGATVTAFDEAAGTITMSAPATSSSASAVVRYGSGKVFTKTEGTAPNRVFVIEWSGYNDYATTVATSNYMSFQLRLEETSNAISIVYGDYFNASTTNRTNQIGLRGATTADYNNRLGAVGNPWTETSSGTASGSTVSRDNTNFPVSGLTFSWNPPACIAPSDLDSSLDSTFTTATLGWTGTASLFDVEWGIAGFTQGSGTLVNNIPTNSLVINSLTPDISYSFYVRQNCGTDGLSAWAGPYTFYTGYCVPTTSGTYYFTNISTTGGDSNISLTKTAKDTGGYGNYSATQIVSGFEGQEIDLSMTMNASTHYFFVWVDFNNDGDFNDAGENIISANTSYSLTYSGTLTIPVLPLGDYRIRIGSSWSGVIQPCGSANGEYQDFKLNIISPPSCLPPTALTATAITANSANLSWTSDGTDFDIKWGATGFNVETEGTLVEDFANGGTLSGLTPATAYQFYVRQDCGGGDLSAWAGPYSFSAVCEAPDAPTAMVFSSVTATATTVGYTAPTVAPTGYTIFRSTSNIPPVLVNGTTYTTSQTTAVASLTTENGTYFCIANPTTLSGTASSLTANTQYYYYVYSRNCSGATVSYSATALSDTMTTSSAAPTSVTVPIATVSFTTADMSWTAPAVGGEAGEYTYFIEVATDSGFTNQIAGSPFNAGVDAVSYSLSDLPQGTFLYVRVRTHNGVSYSPYSTTVNFTTLLPGQVGTGTTTTSNFPIGSGTAYNYTQQLYTKTQIETNLEAGQNFITKIKFYYNGSSSTATPSTTAPATTNFENWTVYLGNTDKTSFDNTTDWVAVEEMQQSFSGTVTFPAPGNWMEIILDEPFQWDGDSNIVVAVDENSAGTYFTAYFRSFTSESNTGMYRRITTDINPEEPGTATGRSNILSQIAFEAIETPDCMPVTGLAADNTTPYTVDLSWAGTESLFDVIYGAPGFNPETEEGTMVPDIAENPYTLSGLDPQTTYQVYVRQHCGGNVSPWTGPVSFSTPCAPEVAPTIVQYFTDFTTTAPNPVCWTEATGAVTENSILSGTTSKWNGGNFGNTGSNTAARINLYGTNSDWLMSQQIDLGITPGVYRLKYDMAVTSYLGTTLQTTLDTHIVRVIVSTDGGNTWSVNNTVKTYTGIGSYSNTGQTETVNLEGYSGVVKVAFVATTTSTSPDVYFFVDNFLVEAMPSCLEPSDLTVTNFTFNSAVLDWESDGDDFDIKWGLSDFDLETEGTLVEDFAKGGTLSGLTAETNYQFYVRQNCGGGDLSAWAGPYSFYTGYCLAGTTAGTSYGITSVSTSGGYENDNISNLNSGFTSGGYSNNSATHSVSQFPGGAFDYSVSVAAYTNLEIWIDLDNDLVFDSSELIATHTYTGFSANTFTGSYTLPANLPLGDYRIRVRSRYYWNTIASPCGVVQGETEDYTLSVVAPPSCLPPSALTATPASNSAVLGWESDGNNFDISWGAGTFDAENGTIVSFANGGTLTGLDSNTNYQFYVRQNCGGGDLSAWVGPLSFTTTCLSATVPYLQDFESAIVPALPNCTSIQNVGTGNNWTTATSATSATGFTGKVLQYGYNSSNAANVWFYTQGIELEAGVDYVISYDYGANGYTEKMKVAYGTSPVNTEMTTQLADHPNITGTTKQSNELVFNPATTGVYYFGFHAYSASDQWNLYLDNIRITTKGWTGEVNTAWENSANWRGGVPDATANVVINSTNPANISADVTVNSITLGADADVTVAGSLTTGNITVADGGSFVVENGGDLFQTDVAVNTGVISVKQLSNPMFRLDYTLWSSPVAGQNLQAFSPETLSTRIYKYDAATDTYDNAYPETTFLTGQGYLFRSPNNWVINDGVNTAIEYQGLFTGVPNNGDITVNVITEAYNGLGNPYPSGIDAADLFAENSGIQAIYFWTNSNAPVDGAYATTTNNWATRTTIGGTSADGSAIEPTGEIAKGQGFIAYVNSGTSVSFTNDMRIADGQFFKPMQEEKHRFWLNLYTPDLMLNQILVGYMTEATQGVDSQIDGEMLDYGESALYSLIDNSDKQFVIQGRALPFEAIDVVPLGFTATTAGEFTISLANFDGLFAEGQNIYLKDNVTQAIHNLKESVYTFISEEGIFDTRFEVVYQTTMSVETPELNSNWIVFKQNDRFQILTQGFEMKEVQVFDMLGRTVYASTAEGTAHSIIRIDANQVLIVKITTAEGETLTKKVQN